jgi:tetratricopeptide (TPR) repeat protein
MHVIKGASKGEVKTNNGKVYAIDKVLAEDEQKDLIKLSIKISNQTVPSLLLSEEMPAVGEKVIVIGNPLGLEQTVSDGIVSAIREYKPYGKIIQITAPISPGSSGSPVISTKARVIGIATFQSIKGQNLNFAISIHQLNNFSSTKTYSLQNLQGDKQQKKTNFEKSAFSEGKRLFNAKEYKKALKYFTEAINKSPQSSQNYYYLGMCNIMLNKCGDAVLNFKKAISLKADYAAAYANLGWAYKCIGEFQEAIEACKQSIKIYHDDPNPYYTMGQIYKDLKSYDEAKNAYMQVLRINPNSAEAYYNLACIGGYSAPQQVAFCKEAIRIDPYYVQAHCYLGLLYYRHGDQVGAFREYNIAKKIAPNSIAVRRMFIAIKLMDGINKNGGGSKTNP